MMKKKMIKMELVRINNFFFFRLLCVCTVFFLQIHHSIFFLNKNHIYLISLYRYAVNFASENTILYFLYFLYFYNFVTFCQIQNFIGNHTDKRNSNLSFHNKYFVTVIFRFTTNTMYEYYK